MNTKIAEMTKADYGQVFALWQQAEGLGLHLDECDSSEGVAKYLIRNPGLCFVARDGENLIGDVLCGHDGRRGYLNHLAVAAAYRRRGIGKVLIDRCMAALKDASIQKCNVFVFAENQSAISFWRKLGWRFWDEFGVTGMSFEIE